MAAGVWWLGTKHACSKRRAWMRCKPSDHVARWKALHHALACSAWPSGCCEVRAARSALVVASMLLAVSHMLPGLQKQLVSIAQP